jgi:hypothetical protein
LQRQNQDFSEYRGSRTADADLRIAYPKPPSINSLASKQLAAA